jgi:hypothetical protein
VLGYRTIENVANVGTWYGTGIREIIVEEEVTEVCSTLLEASIAAKESAPRSMTATLSNPITISIKASTGKVI